MYVFLFRGETDDLNESSLTALIHSHMDHRDGAGPLKVRAHVHTLAHIKCTCV